MPTRDLDLRLPTCARLNRHEEVHQAVGIPVWQRPEQRRVDHAEDGHIRADAECQGDDGGCREARRPARLAPREANVLPDLIQPRRTLVAHGFPGLLDAAECTNGRAPGLGRCHSAREVRLGLHVEVIAQLGVHLAVEIPMSQPRE